jgi:hypothetical protein
MKIKLYRILYFIIVLLFIDVITDAPNTIFHIKYVLFLSIFVLWFYNFFMFGYDANKPLFFILIFISFFMPFYGLSIGIIDSTLSGSDLGTMSYFNSFFFFALVIVVYDLKFNLTKIFVYSSLLLVLITIVTYLVLIINRNQFLLVYDYLVNDKQIAIFSSRTIAGIPIIMLFYKASPILVITLSYLMFDLLIKKEKKSRIIKIILSSSIVFTLFLSGTRANILSAILILVIYLYWFVYRNSKYSFVLLTYIFCFSLILIIPSFIKVFFDPTEASNHIKSGHLKSYFDLFGNDPVQLIFGHGIGSSFFSNGLNKFVDVSELTYFEIIRIWGIVIASMFFVILCIPIVMEIIRKKFDYLFIGYISYLFICWTNPLLLSSTGMIVLVLVYSTVFLKSGTYAD